MPKKLSKLTQNIAARQKQPQPKKKAPIPRIDDTPERIAKAIEQAQAGNMDEVVSILKQILAKDVSVEVDAQAIGVAVGNEIAKLPTPEVKFPEREPISYSARVTERSSRGDMVTARIDPIIE